MMRRVIELTLPPNGVMWLRINGRLGSGGTW